jgi:Ca2+/Na+ antiporter
VSRIWTTVVVVFAVIAVSALLGLMMYGLGKHTERSQSNPKYRRRNAILLAAIYVFSMYAGISGVVRGEEPAWTLIFLPIPIVLVYVLLRSASQVKNPEKKQ